MKSSVVAIALLTSALGASLFSLSESVQTVQATLVDIRTPADPCTKVIRPWWCDNPDIPRQPIEWPPGPGPCLCPNVVIPENLGENETIVIETIPGRVSDTLVISKQLNPQPLPPGEGNITLNR